MNTNTQPGFVELHLLRHGPPHNQLLSPLTEYLALCGDHPNTTLHIPLEHAALETRLRALRYFDSEETRVDQLSEMARIASDLMAQVPGLIAELSTDRRDGVPFVHLSIASRASELALFPFELALAPDGFPGAGQPVALQRKMPVSVTRRSPNVRNDDINWDREVKILMVASDAADEIPVLQHYALLRKLVEPWVGTIRSEDERVKEKLKGILQLLSNASADAITRKLSDEVERTGKPFTHIHVLAHGCELTGNDHRSGIALHSLTRRDKFDAVSGMRLAEILGYLPDYPASARTHRGPSVVTLATCSSADQGGVTRPGASVAFELHDSGVPLVVGSQFPLTAEGSIVMTEALYRGFLAGHDPRSVVWEARRALHAHVPQAPFDCKKKERAAHDWASLTVYAALPWRLNQQLVSHRRRQEHSRLSVRLNNVYWLETKADEVGKNAKSNDTMAAFDFENAWKSFEDAAEEVVDEATQFAQWIKQNDHQDQADRVTSSGLLASAQKQIGLMWLRRAVGKVPPKVKYVGNDWADDGEIWLRGARTSYTRVFESARDKTWALVQSMALDLALEGTFDRQRLNDARYLSQLDRKFEDIERRVDALAALLELEFLDWLQHELSGKEFRKSTDAGDLAKRICDMYSNVQARPAVLSARRQFQRYETDFAELAYFAKLYPDPAERFEARLKIRKPTRPPKKGAKATPYDGGVPEGEPGYQAFQAIREIVRSFEKLDELSELD